MYMDRYSVDSIEKHRIQLKMKIELLNNKANEVRASWEKRTI